MGSISKLSEDIIHHILSFLTTKEAARISIFCKTWYRAWLTCPSLDFGRSEDNSKEFIKFIKKTLRRYQEGKLCIDQLILGLGIVNSYLTSLVDEWIGVAVEHGVKRFGLSFGNVQVRKDRYPYILPRVIFEAKSLRELAVRGVNMNLKEQIISDKAMFSHLHKLHLCSVYIDDDMFQGIMERCSLIDDLEVMYCKSLKRIKVTNLYNLKKLKVTAYQAQPIEIYAPNLQYFDCRTSYSGSFDLYTTENLKYLSLSSAAVPSATFFDDFMQKCPQLEDLRLNTSLDLKSINISSHSLKHIAIVAPANLREIKIDAPNMVSLDFDSSSIDLPCLSLVSVPSRQRIMSRISVMSSSCMDAHLFCQLKGFLEKLIHSKISLHLQFRHPQHAQHCCFDYYVTGIPIFPLMEVENTHLSFDVGAALTNANSFLDALFRTYCPKAIEMNRYEEATALLYSSLTDKRYELEHTYRHLNKVRFEIYDETKHAWQPINWKDMLEAPQHWKRVCFRLQWGAHFRRRM